MLIPTPTHAAAALVSTSVGDEAAIVPGVSKRPDFEGVGPERTPDLVHRRIELQSELRPDAVAVSFRDETLTYGELNRRANRLARQLIAAGVQPEERVVACLEPSVDVPTALLAVLKAGAVYVPVDPTYPPARLRTLFEETRPALVLVQGRRSRQIASDCPTATTWVVDAEGNHDDGIPETNLALSIAPEQTASIYYTSGTTGVPKGVMASCANLAHYIDVAQRRYRFGDSDVMPAIARFSFSISMFELLLPLVTGGTLLMLEREHVLDLNRLSRTLRQVTFFHAGPALLKNVLPYIKRHYPDPGLFSGVRHASSGGDLVPVDVLDALKDIFANAEVFVIYGCTEISCMGCTYPVARGRPSLHGCVGLPFDGMTVRVVDAASNEVSQGVAGEVIFAGRGVVKGYLNQPDKTAEKFVDIEGQRFYRTGDMGRIHDDGSLQLLGRSDFQVKIRGMRVELGEVEHQLRRAPGVRDAAAAARESANGEKVLVAYVVMADDADKSEPSSAARLSSVRQHMAENLPDYMVPARYVELPALPLNLNMKLDRRALPDAPPLPSISGHGEDPTARDPETPTERCLASLWMKLLQVDRVALDDRFFDLGGDSMLALAMILEVDRELGIALDGLEVLHEPLEVLASICDRRLGRGAHLRAATRAKGDTAGARVRAPEAASQPTEPFHFGPEQTLYGVLHSSRSAGGDLAVLLCPPVGAESARTHFILQQLARHLAAHGIAAMRFDYFGCADSLGDNIEASCDRWQADIRDALAECRRKTKARRVVAVGVRFGATLLWNMARDVDFLAGLVLWDPVGRGSEYYAEMTAGHRAYLGSVKHLRFGLRASREGARGRGREELLGLTYSDEALRQMKALVMMPTASGRAIPVKWIATWRQARQEALFRSVVGERETSRFETIPLDHRWDDVAQVDRVLPDVGIARRLSAMVKELA